MTDAHTPDMRVPVVIAGREINMRPVTPEQVISLQMAESDTVGDGVRLKVISGVFLSMMPTEDDRTHLMMALAEQKYTIADLNDTIRRIITTDPVDINAKPAPTVPPRARKAAAKKTVKRT